jgi:putative endonuclease
MVAAVWLQLKGYRVLARRVRLREGEIDLITRRGRLVAVVEVKTRRRAETGFDALTAAAERRIAEAASAWLDARPGLRALELRFDLVIIAPWSWPIHVRDAWRAGWR